MTETCRERIAREHPDRLSSMWFGGVYGCPSRYGYLDDPDECYPCESECSKCWNREIPETIEEKENTIMSVDSTRKTKTQLLEEIDGLKTDLKRLEKYSKYDESAAEMKALYNSYVRAGFTEDQAFTIMLVTIKGAMKLGM